MTFSQELDRLSLHFVKSPCKSQIAGRRTRLGEHPDVVLGEAELDTDAIAQLRTEVSLVSFARSDTRTQAARVPTPRGANFSVGRRTVEDTVDSGQRACTGCGIASRTVVAGSGRSGGPLHVGERGRRRRAEDVRGAPRPSLKFPVHSKKFPVPRKNSLFRFVGNFAASH